MVGDPREGPARFEPKPTAEAHFSWLRTRLSTERTLMSWVRTGVSLIGFGFKIFQVAARLPGTVPAHGLFPEAPRYLGLGLIGGGTLYKIRMPLPDAGDDPLLPNKLSEILGELACRGRVHQQDPFGATRSS